MLQNKKKIEVRSATVFCVTVLLLLFFAVPIVSADFVMPVTPVGAPGNFDDAVLNATNWILGFVTALGVLALIWGSINYLISAGNEEQARTGKQTIKYALLGLVVAGISWAIVNVIVTTIL